MPAKTAAPRPVPAATPSPSALSGPAPASATPLLGLPWWRRFDVRLAAIFGGISLLIITVSAFFTYQLIIDARMDSFRDRLESLALTLAQTVEVDAIPKLASLPDQGAAWRERWQEKLLTIVRSEPDIDSIYILLATDQPAQLSFLLDASKVSRVATAGERYDASEYPFMLRAFSSVQVEDRVFADDFGATQSGYAPLRTSTGEVAGIIGVDVLAVRLDETRRQVLRLCFLLFGLSALSILGVAALVRGLVNRPISRVLVAADDISAGRYETRTAIRSRDEFGLLGDRIDTMAGQLAERERIRATLGLYVSSDLARTLLATGKLPELGGTECLATVVFCDLSQYTRISECFTPSEIVSLINEYLGAMTEVIEAHGGCVLDFNGDGIMAVFGAPIPHPDHAERALRSALRMQQRMNQLNGEWEARDLALRWQETGIEEIILRIGLHTGPLVAGNIGNHSRMRYCVMGDTVNVAARLEEMNKELGTRIALSEDVRQRCPNELVRDLVDCDFRTIRGRQNLLRVHAV